MKLPVEIDESNFDVEVLQSQQPVLVDFWAEWCGPCKMLAPVLNEIAIENSERLRVVKVNIDTAPVLAARFGIQSIPTLLYFTKGEVKGRTVGVASKKAIVTKLESIALAA